jgi:hypothetical protein
MTSEVMVGAGTRRRSGARRVARGLAAILNVTVVLVACGGISDLRLVRVPRPLGTDECLTHLARGHRHRAPPGRFRDP